MNQTEELRSYIRNILLKLKKQQKESLKNELREEKKLRKTIRFALIENKKINALWTFWPLKKLNEVKETAPHESTGINLLAKLLDNIIPVVETGYKNLTTDVKQRKSFRAHILKATQNLLSTASIYFDDDDKNEKEITQKGSEESVETELTEQDTDPKKKMFIDIKRDEKEKEIEAEKDPENAFQQIEGEDTTGRAFALETFKKIQKQTLESYSLLSNPEDRKKFYKYLITNLGLYFDQFEDELKTIVPEPTTPEYEAEKAKKKAELEAVASPAEDAISQEPVENEPPLPPTA
jgi:hypothetical protein